MIEIRFATVVLWTRDMGPMLSFYRDVLGFSLNDRKGDGRYRPGITWSELDAPARASGEPELELLDEATHDPPPPRAGTHAGGPLIALQVDDIHEAVAHLDAHDVQRAPEIVEESWGWFCCFTDPDGNDLEVFQYRSEDPLAGR